MADDDEFYEPDFEPGTPSTLYGGEDRLRDDDALRDMRVGSGLRRSRPSSAVPEALDNPPYDTAYTESHPLSRGVSRRAPGHLTESSRRLNLPKPPGTQQQGQGSGQRPVNQHHQYQHQPQQQQYDQGEIPAHPRQGLPYQDPDDPQQTWYYQQSQPQPQQQQQPQAQPPLPVDYPHPPPLQPHGPRWLPSREDPSAAGGGGPRYPLQSQLSGRRLSARRISVDPGSNFEKGLQAHPPAGYQPTSGTVGGGGAAANGPAPSPTARELFGGPDLHVAAIPEGDWEGDISPQVEPQAQRCQEQRYLRHQEQQEEEDQGHPQGQGRPQSQRRLSSSHVQTFGQERRQSQGQQEHRSQQSTQQLHWDEQAQDTWPLQQPPAPAPARGGQAGLGAEPSGHSNAWPVTGPETEPEELVDIDELVEDVAAEQGQEETGAAKPPLEARPQPPPAAAPTAKRGSRPPELDLSASRDYDAGGGVDSGDVSSPATAAAAGPGAAPLPSVRSSGGAAAPRSYRSLPSASSLPSLSGAAGAEPASVRYADVFRMYDKDNDDRIDSETMVAAFEELGLLAGTQAKQLGELLGLPADWAARKRAYAPHEFIAFCDKLASCQAKAAREERIRVASRLPGVPAGAERSKLLRRLYTRYAVAPGQGRLVSDDDFMEPRLTGGQLQRLITDMGLMQPTGPMTAASVGVVFAKCKPPGTRKLSFPNFLRALAATEEECAGMADVWLMVHDFALKTKEKRTSAASLSPLQRGRGPGRARSNKAISLSGEHEPLPASGGYFSDQGNGPRLPPIVAPPPPPPVAIGASGDGLANGRLPSPSHRVGKYPYERKFSEPALPPGRTLNIKVAASFPAPHASRTVIEPGLLPSPVAGSGAGGGGALPGVLAPIPAPRQAFVTPAPAPPAPSRAPDGNLLSDPLLASVRPKPPIQRSLTGIATLPQGYAILTSHSSAPQPLEIVAMPAGSGTPGTSASASTSETRPRVSLHGEGAGGVAASESSLQALVHRVAALEVQSQEHRARHAELRLEVFQRMSDLAAVTAGSAADPQDPRSAQTAADAAQVAVTASGTAYRANESAAAARRSADQAATLAAAANEGVEALEERMDALEERVEACEESVDVGAVEAGRVGRLEEEVREQRQALEASREELGRLQSSVASDLTQLSESVVAIVATSVSTQMDELLEQRLGRLTAEVVEQLEQRLLSRLSAELEAQLEERLRGRIPPHPPPAAAATPAEAITYDEEGAAEQPRGLKSREERVQSMSGGGAEEQEEQRRRMEALETALKVAEGGAAAARAAAEAAEARIVAMQAMQTALDTAAAAAATPAILLPPPRPLSAVARRTEGGGGDGDLLAWLEMRVVQLAAAADAHAVQLQKLHAVQDQMQAAATTAIAASTAAAVAASEQRITAAAATAAAALSTATRAAEAAEEARRRAEVVAAATAAADRAIEAIAAQRGAIASPVSVSQGQATQERGSRQKHEVAEDDADGLSAVDGAVEAVAVTEGDRAPSVASSSGLEREWGEQMQAYVANQMDQGAPEVGGGNGGGGAAAGDSTAAIVAGAAAAATEQHLAPLAARVASCEAAGAADAAALRMHQAVLDEHFRTLDEHAAELRRLAMALEQLHHQQQQQQLVKPGTATAAAAAAAGPNAADQEAAAAAPPPRRISPSSVPGDPATAPEMMTRLEAHLAGANDTFRQLRSDVDRLAVKVSELESREAGGGQWPQAPGGGGGGGGGPPVPRRPSSAFGAPGLALGPRPARRSGATSGLGPGPGPGGAPGPRPGTEMGLPEVDAKAGGDDGGEGRSSGADGSTAKADGAPVSAQALVDDLERRLREELDQALQELVHHAGGLEELQSRVALLEKAHLAAAGAGQEVSRKDLQDLQSFTHTAMEELSVSVRRLEGLTADIGTDMQYAARDVGRMLVQVRHLQQLYGELAEAAGLSRPQGAEPAKPEPQEAVTAA